MGEETQIPRPPPRDGFKGALPRLATHYLIKNYTAFRDLICMPKKRQPGDPLKAFVFWNGSCKRWIVQCYKDCKLLFKRNFKDEEKAIEIKDIFNVDQCIPPRKKSSCATIKGYLKSHVTWLTKQSRWHVCCTSKRTPVFSRFYEEKEEALEISEKFNRDQIIPPLNEKLSGGKCPGPQNAAVPCNKGNYPLRNGFHDIVTQTMLGSCCSKECLDNRYQTQEYMNGAQMMRNKEIVEKREKRTTAREAYIDIRLKYGTRDSPYTEAQAECFASVYFYDLIFTILAMLRSEGIVDQCALGVQYTSDYRAKSEGTHLLNRPDLKIKLEKHGVIEHAGEDERVPPETQWKVMITKVLSRCDPGYSLIHMEKEIQSLCIDASYDGALLGCTLLFGKVHMVGGAGTFLLFCDAVSSFTLRRMSAMSWRVKFVIWIRVTVLGNILSRTPFWRLAGQWFPMAFAAILVAALSCDQAPSPGTNCSRPLTRRRRACSRLLTRLRRQCDSSVTFIT